MAQRLLCVQHDESDGPGTIAEWAFERQIELEICTLDQCLPGDIEEIAMLIILGGAMFHVLDKLWDTVLEF